MRTWGGRFSGETDARAADFTRSIEIDAALAADDIAGSIAHVRGLARAGILTDAEAAILVDGLLALADDVADGRVAWDPSLEDIHMNVEAALAERVGPLAGRLHTGRSRNDQVATDLRLWTRRSIDDLDARHPRLRARARRPGRARRHGRPARDDPHPAGPAGPVRPPPAGLRRDGRARPGPAGRRAPPGRHLAARVGGAGRCRLPARSRGDGRRDGLRRHHARTRSTRSRTATSRSRRWPRSRSGWSTSAGWPRRSPGGRTRGSASSGSRTRSRPAAR